MAFHFTTPYIVASRTNDQLISRLQEDNYPILLEGIHTTGILSKLNRQDRKIVVRMHNEESLYYKELARAETWYFKKNIFSERKPFIEKI